MSEKSVKVGDIVFAADLVKVLKATKYFHMTYYDLNSLNFVEKLRAHRAFYLLSTDYPNFLHWEINGISAENNAFIENGLTADTSAYMHSYNEFYVTYYNYNQRPAYADKDLQKNVFMLTNDIYLSNCAGEIMQLKDNYDYMLSDASQLGFSLSTYRFLGWKQNDYGKMLNVGTIVKLQDNTDFYGQWIKQYWFTLTSSNDNHGRSKLINREYDPTKHYGNWYDVSALMQISACPAYHYHFARHNAYYIDLNGNTPKELLYKITELCGNLANFILSNNIKIVTDYEVDKHTISFNTNAKDLGIVKITANKLTYYNSSTEFLTASADWNSNVAILASNTSKLSSFLRWNGNIPGEYVYKRAFNMQIKNDLTATAMYEPNNIYSVCLYANNSNFGIVEVNHDPETPELPTGMFVDGKIKEFNIIVSTTPKPGATFLYWLDDNGNKYTDSKFVLTNAIDKNYKLTAYYDVRLIDHTIDQIITHDNNGIDYNPVD